MNARRFNDFLAETRQNLDPDGEVIFIYDGAPAHRNPAIPAMYRLYIMPCFGKTYCYISKTIHSVTGSPHIRLEYE